MSGRNFAWQDTRVYDEPPEQLERDYSHGDPLSPAKACVTGVVLVTIFWGAVAAILVGIL
jgi:hypothetical protein